MMRGLRVGWFGARGGQPADGLPSPLLRGACHWSDTYDCLAHLQAVLRDQQGHILQAREALAYDQTVIPEAEQPAAPSWAFLTRS